MKSSRTRPEALIRMEEDMLEEPDFDVYSEDLDDEDAMDRGMKAHEVAFLRGFKRFN
ncbi:MAG: hypothetical protein KKD17_05125 [Nanoarchaeota archaeon]|nr:hypothetical protein [Nanoarchaeota archaeon]